MSSPSVQPSQPQPTPSSPSDDPASQSHQGGLSSTSIGLICAFLICFTFFVYISSKPPRISEPVRASSSRPKRNNPKPPRPKLWAIWLYDHPHYELSPPDKAVCNWRPLSAWTNDDPWTEGLRQSPLHPEMMMRPHVAIAQAWFRGTYALHPRAERSAAGQFPAPPVPPELPPVVSDPRKLNVAILVAMPSRRKFAPSVSESVPHPVIESGLSYDEGQLAMGVTSLPCEEQAIRDALRQTM